MLVSLTIVGLFAGAEARTVHVAVPTLSMVVIAFTAAKEKGYYRDEGLDVDLVVMRDTLGISALIGGNVDFASMSGAGLTAILGGVPLRFAFQQFLSPHVLDLREAGDSGHQGAQGKKDCCDRPG